MARIAEIALLAVQIGMHPGAGRLVLTLLRALMRLVPVALGVPPERLQRRREPGGRLIARQRVLVGLEIHVSLPESATSGRARDRRSGPRPRPDRRPGTPPPAR